MTKITSTNFCNHDQSVQAKLFTLDNGTVKASITNYGGTIVSLLVPDKNGVVCDVLLGYESIDGYQKNGGYLGATIGRFGNRIGKAAFSLNGKTYPLYKNDGNNHLHGGKEGYDKRVWDYEIVKQGDDEALRLCLLSPDGDEGYPGNLSVSVTFSLSADHALALHYIANTDANTILNLTNHSYFNLKGQDKGDITDHTIQMNSQFYTAADSESIPTGDIVHVVGTPMDFTTPHIIGERIDDHSFADLVYGKGYDHNYIIDKKYEDQTLEVAAIVAEPTSGRVMTVLTNQPAVQLYCGNCLDGAIGKGGMVYAPRTGFCLETQKYPDSPNRAHFTSCVLHPDETYDYTTVYQFGVK